MAFHIGRRLYAWNVDFNRRPSMGLLLSELGERQDRAVRIVGKVTQLRGTQATIDSNGPVTVNLRKVSFASIRFEYLLLIRIRIPISRSTTMLKLLEE